MSLMSSTMSAGFSFQTFSDGTDLTVAPIETSKDAIEQPPLAKDKRMFIPPLGSSVVISGKSGSGKSTLLANLIKDPRFYGPSEQKPKGWFDKVFLFSPTANGDDVQKSLDIPKKHVFTDLEEAAEMIDVILDTQQQKIDKADGADKVPQFAIIFDDVIGDTKFMNAKAFSRCFYQVRHVNCTTFICTQHFKKVPKICRLQANFTFFFQGSAAEVEVVVDEYAPPMYTRNEFRRLVNEASSKKYSFLTINMKVGWDLRFRRNLDEFIHLDRLVADEDGIDGDSGDKQEETNDTKDYDEEHKEQVNFASDLIVSDRKRRRQDATDEQKTHGWASSGSRGGADWRDDGDY